MIARHTVGSALVLHAREQISAEARSMALSVPSDPDNDIVILDLHDELPFDVWDSVAAALHRRGRGIRLMVCGAHPETGALAGQWLSDRLGRPVIAPFGRLIPGAAGLLFVHAADLGGWVCYRQGRTPVWQSKRYPVPAWDGAAVDYLPISSTTAAEPLPGGVWLRESRDEAAIAEHWHRLMSTMPCQPHAMSVILGCPGTAPLSLDDIARFWRGLAPQGRSHARFVHYGPVALRTGETVGQALADLLESPVVLFGGVPAGKPSEPGLFTVGSDGRPGWQVFARELAYHPRDSRGSAARTPRILGHRAPELLGEPLGALAYRYTDDAVVEVIQSGLWLRGEEPPGYADRIRAIPADPDSMRIVVDDAAPALVDRYRELAGDLAGRLDPATRDRTTTPLSSVAVRAGLRAPGPAGGVVTAPQDVPGRPPHDVRDRPSHDVPGRPPHDVQGRPEPASVPEPAVAPPNLTVAGPAVVAEPAPAEGVAAPAPAEAVAAPAPVEPPTSPPARPSWAAGPTMALPLRRPDHPAAPSKPAPAWAAVTLEIPAVASPATAPPPPAVASPATAPPPPAVASPATAPPPPVVREPAEAGASGYFQQTPGDEVRAYRPDLDPAAERAWLRRAFSREFEAVSGGIARILAEHAILQSGPEALEHAVAVRLYLSVWGDSVDKMLRLAEPGVHVSFARCVATGLSRLPSHRGVTYAAADLTTDEMRQLTRRETLTDWGFTNALIERPAGLPGNVEVMLWSTTARRTRLLEPEGDAGLPGRVLFLPGTSFKVLELREPADGARGLLLLRELVRDEAGFGRRVPLDDLALAALRRSVERDAGAGPSLPTSIASRFLGVPGMI
ncbi:hypothetical protein [Actinoplanes philippinensis]|uniref:hypothetical protein n=1 Tax=Actinoplanes philippinensis TaxID=35752 RepID=UPI000B82EA6B|nr:hypothetical protein [Actinoplanes philippinensis]